MLASLPFWIMVGISLLAGLAFYGAFSKRFIPIPLPFRILGSVMGSTMFFLMSAPGFTVHLDPEYVAVLKNDESRVVFGKGAWIWTNEWNRRARDLKIVPAYTLFPKDNRIS